MLWFVFYMFISPLFRQSRLCPVIVELALARIMHNYGPRWLVGWALFSWEWTREGWSVVVVRIIRADPDNGNLNGNDIGSSSICRIKC